MISLTDLGFAASQAWGSVCLAESCQAEVCFSNASIAMVIKHFSLLNVLSPEMPKLFTQLKCFSQHQNIGMDYYPSGGSNQNTGKEGESGLLMPMAKGKQNLGQKLLQTRCRWNQIWFTYKSTVLHVLVLRQCLAFFFCLNHYTSCSF